MKNFSLFQQTSSFTFSCCSSSFFGIYKCMWFSFVAVLYFYQFSEHYDVIFPYQLIEQLILAWITEDFGALFSSWLLLFAIIYQTEVIFLINKKKLSCCILIFLFYLYYCMLLFAIIPLLLYFNFLGALYTKNLLKHLIMTRAGNYID